MDASFARLKAFAASSTGSRPPSPPMTARSSGEFSIPTRPSSTKISTPGFYRFPPLGYNVKPQQDGTYTESESDRVNSDFKRGLEKLYEGRFENHNWSDLILRCREYTFYLHRVVLGPQSDFFANLLHPDSPIGGTGVISLDDDEPILVDGLLGYFYTSRVQKSSVIDGDLICSDPGRSMAYAVGLYGIAEKYQVSELKEQAWRAFMDDAVRQQGWRHPDFPQVVSLIFESTPESDKRLRCVALAIVKTRLKYFTRNPAFVEEMDGIEGFWAAFAQYSATWPWMELYRCQTCGEVMMNLPWEEDERSPSCWGCHAVDDHKTWRANMVKYDPNEEEEKEEAERAAKRQRMD
ncbi:BTB/POZ domain containing protein [Lasiodiplodia theobromae]|uniref:BTB domain-containing protein n=1 Tax=Lasiodiplodia theobromae TaxID=45133 RepID=A0A5N5D6R4_9PEZI|nr:BTB/POZ domain containing protein [Lasiodiplodia theobromae]KAB2573307.1 hypothetical protein DBV05_g8037 [Lasiodiplodia theobromae]KAF4541512.1 BTB/POZ domain containing protein [Lasiodiplodia theobromae]